MRCCQLAGNNYDDPYKELNQLVMALCLSLKGPNGQRGYSSAITIGWFDGLNFSLRHGSRCPVMHSPSHVALPFHSHLPPFDALYAQAFACVGNALAQLLAKSNNRPIGNHRLSKNGCACHVLPPTNKPPQNGTCPHQTPLLDHVPQDRGRHVSVPN